MGSGSNVGKTQTEVKCTHCGGYVHADCDWRQGRCPHQQPLLHMPYVERFFNLLNFFRRK